MQVIFTQLIDRIPAPNEVATQTLILVHRRELVEQAARHCVVAYPSKTVEIEMGNTTASGFADITIASVQSITSGDRMLKFKAERFKLVLVDEAHHIVAAGYMKTLGHFGLLEPTATSPALVGVSATMSRFDGLRLGAAIDHIVYHKDYVDMIGEKWLADVLFTTVKSNADISKVKKSSFGEFMTGELSKAVNTEQTNEITVRAWLSRAKGRKSTIVFCVDLNHVAGLTEMFRKYGIDARSVTSNTHQKIRGDRLEAFKAHEFPVLINCGVFTEGTDIPNIDCVLLARPTRSRNLLVQMIGRGMRLYPGKENCHVIDMVASLESGIVTVPTLFGLDPFEVVKEADVNKLKQLRQQREIEVGGFDTGAIGHSSQKASASQLTFTDYSSVYDLLNDSSAERHIRAISPLAWVEVGDDRYILSGQAGAHIVLEKTGLPEPLYRVRYNPRVTIETSPETSNTKWRPYQRTREVATATTFMDAVHAADTFATKSFPAFMIMLRQSWRKGPATAEQLAFLEKLQGTSKSELSPDKISKGRAMEMITKIKFGARGRFAKLQAQQKARQKAQRLEDREDVRIGPLAV
jgi:ATP-dependent helicase IRC3